MNDEELKMLIAGLRIDRNNLDSELERQSANLFYVSELASQWEMKVEEAKDKLARIEANLSTQVREKSVSKLTESQVNAIVILDPIYIESKAILSRLKYERDRLKALKDAYYSRKDCLVQLSINMRGEFAALNTTIKK